MKRGVLELTLMDGHKCTKTSWEIVSVDVKESDGPDGSRMVAIAAIVPPPEEDDDDDDDDDDEENGGN